MKITALIAMLLLSFGFLSFHQSKSEQVKHIVVFKYKEGTTPEQIEEVSKVFADLKNKIPGIVSFEHGTNNSPEKLNKGFDHVYLLTFENAAARDKYLPHPDHDKFGEFLTTHPVVQEVFVVDFTPTK